MPGARLIERRPGIGQRPGRLAVLVDRAGERPERAHELLDGAVEALGERLGTQPLEGDGRRRTVKRARKPKGSGGSKAAGKEKRRRR